MGFYRKHIFICTNRKDNQQKCCAQGGAEEICEYLKEKLKALQLHGQGQIRVSRSGCLGRCAKGPNLLIYPDEIWYHYENKADVDEIINKHLQNGEIVERLLVE